MWIFKSHLVFEHLTSVISFCPLMDTVVTLTVEREIKIKKNKNKDYQRQVFKSHFLCYSFVKGIDNILTEVC